MPFYSPQTIRRSALRIPLLSDALAREHEQHVQTALEPHTLMQRAGIALARFTLAMYPHATCIAVCCGPGNNGGDGYVAATWLLARGVQVALYAAAPPVNASADLLWARDNFLKAGGKLNDLHALDAAALANSDVVIDALFGAGLNRELSSPWADCIALINASQRPVIAADLPSGLQADTGVAMGNAIKATATLALLSLRPGHFTGQATAHHGELWFHDLDIPVAEYSSIDCILLANHIDLPTVSATHHKGSRGTVAIIGGASGMRGAPLLGARAALACGAGRVHVGFLKTQEAEVTPELDAAEPSLMCHAISRQVWPFEADTWVYGPGAGMSEDARQVFQVLLAHTHDQLLVIDADGLNLLSTHDALTETLHLRRTPAVLTPHPLEAARLLKLNTREVENDRIQAARKLAARYASVVVLKGAGTVIAAPDGRCAINPTGGAWLATAGSGDVLAGVIAAFLAQGMEAFKAACSAVYFHGCQQDMLANNNILPTVASQQPALIAAAIKQYQTQGTSK